MLSGWVCLDWLVLLRASDCRAFFIVVSVPQMAIYSVFFDFSHFTTGTPPCATDRV